MGDPKRQRKKYDTPRHPWEKGRIEREAAIMKTYGLKNKREVWRMETMLRNIRRMARNLISAREEDAKVKEAELLGKLKKLGILKKDDSTLDDILSLKIDDLLNRRLQTVVYNRGLARTIKEARQLIVHGHISLAGRRITVPSYFVKVDEEELIGYSQGSPVIKKKAASEG